MAVREKDQQLEELRQQGITVYSISRIDTINNCLYEAYKTYQLHEKGKGSIYGYMGTKVHDVLEFITKGEATEEDLLPAMQSELEEMEMLGISFPKDQRGGDAIRDGWISDITHFCNTYKAPQGDFETEKLFLVQTPKGRWLQGYIDLLKHNKDESISIYDYKTSSMYTGEAIKEHGRQLVLYAIGMMAQDYVVKSVSWIMLKYVEIRYMGKKTSRSKEKTLISKVIERKKIATEMSKVIEQDLYEAGYDEVDTEIYLHEFRNKNTFDCLPESVRDNYKMLPYVMNYEINDEVIEECLNYIDNTIDLWERLGEDENNFTPRKFTKLQKNGKEVSDTFFCVALCNHRDTCPHIKDYLDKQNAMNKTEDEDLF